MQAHRRSVISRMGINHEELAVLLVEVLNVLHALLLVLLVHRLLGAGVHLGTGVELLNGLNAQVVVCDADWLVMLHALLRTSAAIQELVQVVVRRRAHQL